MPYVNGLQNQVSGLGSHGRLGEHHLIALQSRKSARCTANTVYLLAYESGSLHLFSHRRLLFSASLDMQMALHTHERTSNSTAVTQSAYPTIEDYVGNTPLVRLQRLSSNPSNVILAKLEGNNPAGSVKDR